MCLWIFYDFLILGTGRSVTRMRSLNLHFVLYRLTSVRDGVRSGVHVVTGLRLVLGLVAGLNGLRLVISTRLLVLESVLGLRLRLLVLRLLVLLLLGLLVLGGLLVVLGTGSRGLLHGGGGRAVVTLVLPVDAGILAVLAVILLSRGQGTDGSGVVLVVGGWRRDVDVSAWREQMVVVDIRKVVVENQLEK